MAYLKTFSIVLTAVILVRIFNGPSDYYISTAYGAAWALATHAYLNKS